MDAARRFVVNQLGAVPEIAAGQKAMHDDLTALWSKNNVATDGSTRVLSEYIEVVGTRA